MNYSVVKKNRVGIISSEVEKVNGSNADELKTCITTLNDDNLNSIIIDLSNTSYCDSSGLSAILMANRLCKNGSGKFVLTGLQPNVEKLIKIAKLDRVLCITKDLTEAENLF